jgi:hypothetical protein
MRDKKKRTYNAYRSLADVDRTRPEDYDEGNGVPVDPFFPALSIRTKFDADTQTIIQEEKGWMGKIIQSHMDLREKGIREALIKAGWTPPTSEILPTNPVDDVPSPGEPESMTMAEEADYQKKLAAVMGKINEADKYTPGQIAQRVKSARQLIVDGMRLCGGFTGERTPPEDKEEADNEQLLSKALRAICLMRDYCPSDMPAKEGWEWFDAGSEIAKAIPHDEWAREFRIRVKIDTKHRAITDSLRSRLEMVDPTCITPMFDVVRGFLTEMSFTDWEIQRLLKCNVIRLTEKIMTEDDQAKLFDEAEIDSDTDGQPIPNVDGNAGLASPDLIRPQDFPEDFDAENGQYWHNCECGLTFTGHKRRGNRCKICTQKDEKVIPIHGSKCLNAMLYDDCPECKGVLKMTWIEGEDKPGMCHWCQTLEDQNGERR